MSGDQYLIGFIADIASEEIAKAKIMFRPESSSCVKQGNILKLSCRGSKGLLVCSTEYQDLDRVPSVSHAATFYYDIELDTKNRVPVSGKSTLRAELENGERLLFNFVSF